MSLRIRPLVWPVLFTAAAVTCSSDSLTLPNEGLPAAFSLVSGNGQTATVATPLPDSLLVRVTDSKARPVEGIKVVFTPTLGGGDAVPDTGVTNSDGRAGTRWVLGHTAGAQRVLAMVVGPTSSGALTQTFDATALAAAADTVFAVRGDGQSAAVGTALTDSLVVRVTDQYGNPVAGQAVDWVPTGGGSVSPAAGSTGVPGTVATARTLGPVAGPQGATATAGTLKGSPVVFAFTAQPAAAASLVKVSGDNQSGAAGSAVAESLVVRLLDADGNGVPGRVVGMTIAIGGGSASPVSATTDSTGRVATQWKLGTVAGPNSLIASAPPFSVTFQATATSSTAAVIAANSATAQSDTAGLPVGARPSVKVTDSNNNPVAGVAVTFAVASGGGSILPTTPVVTNASGVATLTSWTLGAVAGANSVTASVSGLTGSPVVFNASGVPGAATQLLIQTQPAPSAQSGVPFTTQPVVRVADAFGNTVPANGTLIVAALASGTGTLGGTLSAATTGGVATFSNLSIAGSTGTYTIEFTSGTLTPVTSTGVTIGAGAATKLVIVQQPSATSPNATAFAQQPTVQVQDAAGNPVAGVRAVAVAINSGGGTLGGTTPVNTDASGLATFAGLSITGTVGTRNLQFTSSGLTPAASGNIAITAGTATQIAISAGNGQTAVVHTVVTTAPVAVVRDVSGNPVNGVSVTFAVATGGGTILPAAPVATNASGLAALTSWTLGNLVGANTVTATAAGLTGSPLTFSATGTPGPATQLIIQTEPSAAAQSGIALAVQPVVRLGDSYGNTVPTSGTSVLAALTAGAGTLGGTASISTTNGIATYSDLSVTGPTGSYRVRFTSGALTPDTSATITIGAGAATKLAMVQQPSATAQNAVPLPQQPSVQVQDAAGNPVVGVRSVSVALSGGGVLGGTATINSDAAGLATFSGLAITGTVGARTLQFSSSGLAGVNSTSINLTAGAATQIALYAGDGQSATAGSAVAIPPSVIVRDVSSNVVSGVPVTFAVATGGGAILPATAVVTNASGIASATTWTLGTVAGANSATATATGLAGSPVTFTATGTVGTATTLAANSVTSQSDTVGLPVAAPPSVKVTDANGNPVAGVAVTFAVTGGGGSIAPTAAVATDTAGLAKLTTWTLGQTIGTNTVTATVSGLTGSPVTFTSTGVAGTATKLAIVTQPSATAQNAIVLPQQPRVQVQDAFGNVVPGVRSVAVVLGGGGVLGGTTPINTDANGLVTFSGLLITGTVGSRTLQFTSTGLTSVTSGSINLTAGTATQIALNAGNGQSATAGAAVATPPSVIVRDVSNNVVAGVAVTFAVTSGGGAVVPTAAVPSNASGIAALTSWTLGSVAGPNTMTATATGLTGSPVSFTATGTAGTATKLVVVTQPSATAQNAVAFVQQPTVQVQDAAGNPVAGVRSVAVAIASGGGTLSGATSVNTDANGLATFAGLLITGTVGPRTLQFSGAGLANAVSTSITLTAGNATQIALSAGNGQTATAGSAVATPPRVVVRDVSSNPVAGVSVTFAVTGGGGSIVPSTPQTTDASGLAALTSWTLGAVAGANTLTATATGLTGSPVTFTATGVAGSAGKLAMFTQPAGSAASGAVLSPVPVVQLQDGLGNDVATANVGVTVSIASGPGGSLGGSTVALTDPNGRATFTGLRITGPTGSYTLQFTGASLTGVTSSSVTITAGAAAQLAVTAQPTTAQSGVIFPSAPTVQVQDAAGNPVGGVRSISVVLNSGTATLSGPSSQNTNSAGLAAFPSLVLTGPVGPNTLLFSTAGLTSDTTAVIALTAGNAAKLVMVTQPSATAQNAIAFAQQPAVRVLDGANNPVAGVRSVGVAILSGGGTLGGSTPINTDANGLATFSGISITGTIGARTLQFSSSGLTSVNASSVNITAGAATQIALNAGNAQSATVGTAVATPLSVIVRDVSNNVVSGVPVGFAVASGGGTVLPASASTNASGIASTTSWTLGPLAGANSVTATATGLTGSPVTFTATGTAGAATTLVANSVMSQSDTVGLPVAAVPSVRATDANGNPVAGVAVSFAVTAGGGVIAPTAAVTTNASGIATLTSWTLGSATGTNTVTATAAGLTGSPMTFTATAVAGSAARLAMVQQPSATAQNAILLPQQPTVQVQDALGNVVVGVRAVSVALSGGGVLGGSTSINTDANGLAAFSGLLITGTAGARTLQFTSAGLTGATSSSINLTAGTATQIALNAGSGQSATAGSAVPIDPSVIVRDVSNNVVTGVPVTFGVTGGGGAVVPTTPVATNASGIAAVTSWTLGTIAGPNTMTATATGLTGSPVAFAATGTVGAAANLAANSVTSQTDTVGLPVAAPPSVRVTDSNGNPVSGTSVTFAVSSGGGGIVPVGASVTNASGIATLTSWTLGNTVGTNTVTATAAGLAGSPLTFTANGIAGAATALAVTTPPSAAGQSGVVLAVQPAIRLVDSHGNTVQTTGTIINVAVAPVSGTLSGTLSASTTSGVATFTGLTISGPIGSYTLQFTSTGLTQIASGTISIGAGTATKLVMVQQPSATAQSAAAFPQQPSVQVQDASNNPVPGVRSVGVAILTGGGALAGTTPINTDNNGLATFAGLSISGTVGARTLQFTSTGLAAVTSASINLTAGAATQIAPNSATPQSATVGATVGAPPSVVVRDGSNNPVAGVNVTFAVTGGGGTVLPATAVATDASGIATATSWTLGTTAGVNNNTVTATATGLAGSPVTFTASGLAGPATKLAMVTQPSATSQSGVQLAQQPSVRLLDQYNNVVTTSGTAILAQVGSGSGALSGTVSVTTVNGVATFTNLVLSGTAGSFTLDFSSPPLTNVASASILLSAGAATQITFNSATSQSATVGTAVGAPPSVLVRDASNNPVQGVSVTFAVTAGGGAVIPVAAVLTNASGIATATSWTLGTTAGVNNNTVTATAAGLTGSPVLFTASATAGPATQLVVVQQPSASATTDVPFAQQPTVQVQDTYGNSVAGVVSVAVTLNGAGTLGGTTPVSTDPSGLAAFSGLFISGAAGTYSLQFSAAGLTPATSTNITM